MNEAWVWFYNLLSDDAWRLWNVMALIVICTAFTYRTVRDRAIYPFMDWETVAWRCLNIVILAITAVAHGANLDRGTPVYWYVKVLGTIYFLSLLVLIRPWNFRKAFRTVVTMRPPWKHESPWRKGEGPPPSD